MQNRCFVEKIKLPCVFFLCVSGLYAQSSKATTLYADNFESGLGNWTNVSIGDNKSWARDYGGTPSTGTGPSSGAGNSTYYAYLETSYGSAYVAGDTAILLGPVVTESNIHLKFDYHMSGSNTGTLAVDVFSGGGWINDVWTISGQQNSSNSSPYLSTDIDLSNYTVSKVRFRATAAGGYMGDIAIDNVVIESLMTDPVAPVFLEDPILKPAARQEISYSDSIANDVTDNNGDTLTFSKISGPGWLSVASDGSLSGTPGVSDIGANSFVVEVSDGMFSDRATLDIEVNDDSTPVVLYSSDFELDFGDWSNVTVGDNKNWTRYTGSTPSSGTGPSGGANSSKYYVYLETSSGSAYSNGDSAILLGPVMSDSSIQLKFDYHMYGSNMGYLAVDGYANGGWVNNVWLISGQQQSSYSAMYSNVELDLSSYGFSQLRFRATASGGYMGDMAIDNIQILAMNPAKIDSDKDGVFNPSDLCSDTPYGEAVDADGCSLSQIDSDNDGIVDSIDAFPSDPTEWLDTDTDGLGNNTDNDDDADGVLDIDDAFPLDNTESLDTDADGVGDNADTDDDADGVPDIDDTFPLDATETVDTDNDGVGNNSDSDDDNDGVLDVDDKFPLDANESVDTDGDGIGNNMDFDDDNDSLSDEDEINIHQTNPLSDDSDFDDMNDGWEVLYGLQPNGNDAEDDADGDGYTNIHEFRSHTDPTDPDSIPRIPIEDLSLGNNSSCALVSGEITCWGNTVQYSVPSNLTAPTQIGHYDSTNEFCALQGNDVTCWGYASPMITDLQTSPINDAVSLQVANMTNTACVITLSGTIHCWGGTTYGINAPPPGLINVQQMDMFQDHACGHDGMTVRCWGRSNVGQTNVPVDLGVPVQVVVGGLHTCVLQDDHQVRCWGDNSKNQINVPANLGNVVSLDSGYYHTCALNDVGEVNCWGDNSISNQLNVPVELSGATALYSGPYNNCAETNQGALCWGKNDYGQSAIWYDLVDYGVGDDHVCGFNKEKVMCYGKTINQPAALNIPAGITRPKAIGVGRYHSCVWSDTGMHCWGKPGNQLNYPSSLTNVTEIDAEASHTCVIDDGRVVCWGDNINGVLNVPSDISQPHELSTGNDHNCVLDGETTVRCWGANYRGQSISRYNLSNPITVATGGISAYPDSGDDGHTCIADDLGVQCRGSSAYGVLNVPTGLNNVIDLYAGWGSTCALKIDGTVSCWGDFMKQSDLEILNIGTVIKIKGYNAGVCAQSEHKLSCSGGLGGALLINRQ
ncbi:MAG: putative Ig domain-containing protein [Candidatus Thiodiazotropha sp.]